MNTNDIIKIITDCAILYKKNLCNKNFLFATKENSFEVLFNASNYMHLTGVKTTYKANEFFHLCLSKNIDSKKVEFRPDGFTKIKLRILERLINLPKNAKMIGDFDGYSLKLKTEKLIGNTNVVMGFIRSENYFVPNTALEEDIRKIAVYPIQPILLIASKKRTEKTYNNIIFQSKDFDADLLSNEIKLKLNVLNLINTY